MPNHMFTPIIDFRPARVVRGKETYVTYYVTDPTTDKLKRMFADFAADTFSGPRRS